MWRGAQKQALSIRKQQRSPYSTGKRKCPFCGGSKITPFTSTCSSQRCGSCDESGMKKNKRLAELGLEGYIIPKERNRE